MPAKVRDDFAKNFRNIAVDGQDLYDGSSQELIQFGQIPASLRSLLEACKRFARHNYWNTDPDSSVQ